MIDPNLSQHLRPIRIWYHGRCQLGSNITRNLQLIIIWQCSRFDRLHQHIPIALILQEDEKIKYSIAEISLDES